MPPLRERIRDLPELIEFFLMDAAKRHDAGAVRFAADALELMNKYHWPGNIRELRNLCEHVSAISPGKTIDAEAIPIKLDKRSGKAIESTGFELPREGINMEELEVDLIQQSLEYTNGNKSEAARLLGMSRDTFMYRLKKYKL
jgi:DNA-binding NtrC family response regulator